jgi:hypothetical protein
MVAKKNKKEKKKEKKKKEKLKEITKSFVRAIEAFRNLHSWKVSI